MAPVECSRYNHSLADSLYVPKHNNSNLNKIFLTQQRVSQLPTDHTSITAVPGVITDGTPESTQTNLYGSLSLSTSQSDLALSTVGWNCKIYAKTNPIHFTAKHKNLSG